MVIILLILISVKELVVPLTLHLPTIPNHCKSFGSISIVLLTALPIKSGITRLILASHVLLLMEMEIVLLVKVYGLTAVNATLPAVKHVFLRVFWMELTVLHAQINGQAVIVVQDQVVPTALLHMS